MSTIQSQTIPSGFSPRQNSFSDAQFERYVRKDTFHSYESLTAGLTIKTNDGDLVTLTSSAYSEMDAFSYDQKGVLQTESGKAIFTQQFREITLASGEQFSFSVKGDLSEEELKDIEAIVKGIDEIISEVALGDMDDAVEKALSMGGYDSISQYSAQIAHQKSTSMTSEIKEETLKPVPSDYLMSREKGMAASVKDIFEQNGILRKQKLHPLKNLDRLMEKMVEKMKDHEEKQLVRAKKPIDRLFRHHLADMEQDGRGKKRNFHAIDNARNKVEKWMNKMAGSLFTDHLSA